jgi:TolA-binding protein
MVLDRSLLRDIGIGVVVLLCIIGIASVRAARRPAQQEKPPAADVQAPETTAAELPEGETQERKSSEEQARDAIARHEEKIAEDPNGKDVPAYMLAIANLYITKLGDNESASSYLEDLIRRSPDSNLVPEAYAKLAKCYDRMGQPGLAQDIYRRMMQTFPEGSQEWEYAQAKLRGDTNLY